MPRESTAHRKSTLGTRRGPPREHIPFRADDLARGKKTGLAVQYVDRNSDEFEPFDELMKQVDNRLPPRAKSKKKRVSVITPVPEELDEDGEMSMDLAESNQGSPLAYFTNTNPVHALHSPRKLGASRSITRVSDIDYDQIPSPKPRASMRASMANGAGPSSLSKSFVAPDPPLEPDFEFVDQGAYGDDFEPPQPDDSPRRTSPGQLRQADLNEDNNEPAEMETVVFAESKKAEKGKRRANPVEVGDDGDEEPDNVNGVEDNIVQGLGEVENGEDGEEDTRPAKKSRNEETKPKKPRGRSEKRVIKPSVERSPTPDGVRRGRRHRYKPLEYWRQEKVVYGRRKSGMTLVPQIKEIIRIPQEPPQPLGKAGKRKRAAGIRGKSKGRDTSINPEEGWDDETPTNATVIDYATQDEVSRRVAFLAKMIQPKPAANSNWFFQKIFGEGDFIAAGQMHIPPKGQKPSKSTKDNTYVFYVIQGAVSVFIHETNFIITTGGMFLVPRGNTYYIENIAERDAKLFFTQARMVAPEDASLQHTAYSAPPSSIRRATSEDASPAPKRAKSKA
ncbi:hypothetical protein PAXRUDRAFT_822039 [Paxillus rubicundulus Ve08.2h10]|uniref:CENP-C homolog n=1 Tax=Paxillus rubicundulus Ve08.2h10 TaxID=930991 RepID=A0A0D0E5R0_9AGAM|nr:hypothetical protein PAXRUDRAFT_822039 [Paxillus rubicundulus Ve08.2h10]